MLFKNHPGTSSTGSSAERWLCCTSRDVTLMDLFLGDWQGRAAWRSQKLPLLAVAGKHRSAEEALGGQGGRCSRPTVLTEAWPTRGAGCRRGTQAQELTHVQEHSGYNKDAVNRWLSCSWILFPYPSVLVLIYLAALGSPWESLVLGGRASNKNNRGYRPLGTRKPTPFCQPPNGNIHGLNRMPFWSWVSFSSSELCFFVAVS